jgi:hypothetical protein
MEKGACNSCPSSGSRSTPTDVCLKRSAPQGRMAAPQAQRSTAIGGVNFWDALTRQRTDGALVRLITPVYPNENVEDADKRLVSFTREIVPALNEFLPK